MTPPTLTPEWKQITERDDPESEITTASGTVRYITWLEREKLRWAESGKVADVLCGEDGRCALYAKNGHGWNYFGQLD